MYSDTITLFNYHDAVWTPTVLRGVDLNTDRGAILQKYGAASTDRAKLHIAYTQDRDNVIVGGKIVKKPRAYSGDANTITFRPIEDGETADFFIEGVWGSSVDVDDTLYTDGFFNYINASVGGCYRISSVAQYSVIPHFEILAR